MNEQTLDQLQHTAFGYFLQAVNPANGLIADTPRENSPASIGVVGFALSVYPGRWSAAGWRGPMRPNAASRCCLSSTTAIRAKVRRRPVSMRITTARRCRRGRRECSAPYEVLRR
jgi:hypothetical protein